MKRQDPGFMKPIRMFFGLFMVFFYFLLAYALYINFFEFEGIWMKLRYPMAIIIALYGLSRGYRQIKGTDYYVRKNEEEETEHPAKRRKEELEQ